ncbi:MAG: DUF4291 domain-containing protein [Gemmataceae bacterium]
MPEEREIRADYTGDTIVVYQAFSDAIADPALEGKRFVAPFSFRRMTWIKPSFLWLMQRSNWGRKSGQTRTLAVRITRVGWDQALSQGVLTSYERSVYSTPQLWQQEFDKAKVHIQWDTERSLRGSGQTHLSIQVGLSRHIIDEYVHDWIVEIEDYTSRVAKMREFLRSGMAEKAKRLLPAERVYFVEDDVGRKLMMS